MENFSSENLKAHFDHKRFPPPWQAMVACSLMQFIVAIPLFLITFISGADYGKYFRTEFGEYMFNAVLSQFFAVLIIPLIFLLLFRKDMRSTLRLKKNIDFFQILMLVLASLGVFFGAQIINQFFVNGLSSFLGEPSDISDMQAATNFSQLLFEIVIIAGLPAICEEIFFRGFVMRAFERYSPVSAVILSSLAFAIMHGNLQQVLYAFILGLILGTVVMVTDSLLAGTVIHFTLNAASVILSYPPIFQVYEKIANEYSLIYVSVSMILLPSVAVICLIFFIQYSRRKNTKLLGKPFVSDLEYAKKMPKQKAWEKALLIIGWISFIAVNIISMISLWYYDVLTGSLL